MRRRGSGGVMQLAPQTGQMGLGVQPIDHTVRGETPAERAADFHAKNPWILDSLIAMIEEQKARGRTSISMGALFEMLRSRDTIGERYTLNNDHRAYYARMICEKRPDLSGMLRTRRLRS